MATYPIKMMIDESGQPFVPLTSLDAVIGEKNLQYIIDATETSAGHFNIIIKDVTLDKLKNTVVVVRWPQINSTVKPSYLQLNEESEVLLYNGAGTEYLDLEDASNTVNMLAYDGEKWILTSGAGSGSGHVITDEDGNTMEQQKVLSFVGFNVENDAANRATKIVNPTPINNLTTTESGQGSLDAYQGNILSKRSVPAGGTKGQVLAKSGNGDHQLEWINQDSDDVITSDGSVDQIISLTYAEYKALEANGEVSPTTQYVINDVSEKEKTFMTDGEVQTLINNTIDESKNNLGTITVDEVVNKNLFNVFGVNTKHGNFNYRVELDGSLYCPALSGNGGYILYEERYKNDGTYVLSYYRQSNTLTRLMFRCYNAAGEIMTVADVGLEGFTHNSIYQGYWCDFTDSRVSLTLNFNPDVAYFQIGFVGLEYTIKDIMLSRGVIDFDFVPQINYGVWSGYNDNGHWIRYADGTLICRHTVNLGSCTFALYDGGLFTDQTNGGFFSWTFPQPFIDRNTSIQATAMSSAYMCTSTAGLNSDATGVNIYYHTNYACSVNVALSLIAIGRWK